MSKELFFISAPVEFKPGIMVYPPTVRDVITNPLFGHFERVLTYSQEEIEDEFLDTKKQLDVYPTPIEFLLNNSYHNEQYRELCLRAFQFFIHEEVSFLYEQKMIVVGNLQEILKKANSIDDLVFIKEEDFFDFQNLIRASIGKKMIEKPEPNLDPRIAEIKRKSRRAEKLKAKQAAKGKGDGIGFYTTLVSICCMGLGITPLNIGEMSYVALEAILRKYQEKEKYELDIDSLLAGADSKKVKPKYWIRNFED